MKMKTTNNSKKSKIQCFLEKSNITIMDFNKTITTFYLHAKTHFCLYTSTKIAEKITSFFIYIKNDVIF